MWCTEGYKAGQSVLTLLQQPKHWMWKLCAETKFREILYRSPIKVRTSNYLRWNVLGNGEREKPEGRKGGRTAYVPSRGAELDMAQCQCFNGICCIDLWCLLCCLFTKPYGRDLITPCHVILRLTGMEPSDWVISSRLGCACRHSSLKLRLHQRRQFSSWHSCFTLRRILVKNFAKRPAILICVLKILFTVSMHILSCYLKRSYYFPSTCFPVMRSYPTVRYYITCQSERNFFNLLAPELFFLILAHPVYKMWIIQEPNKLA